MNPVTTLHYLAYGSNLHPLRIRERISTARLLGTIKLPGYTLSFSKIGQDKSAKCTIEDAVPSQFVWFAIYSMDLEQKPILDTIEGLNKGYDQKDLSMENRGSSIDVFTYIASPTHIDRSLKPYHDYKETVVLGAEYLGFPRDYIQAIQAVKSVQNPDAEKRVQNEALLERMRVF